MGKNRPINTKMWTDRKVVDKFTSEDKLMWIYLLTNDNLNNLGCYKVSTNKMSFDTGFTKNTIENLLLRFMEYHKVLDYDSITNEILIKNYHKYHWTASPTYRKSLEKLYDDVESKFLKNSLDKIIKEFYGDIVPKVIGDIEVKTNDTDILENDIKKVVDIYNQVMGKNLTYKNKATNDMVRARLNEGHTVSDFNNVIVFKKNEWENTDYAKYLIPSTLFAPSKFSNYLLQSQMGVSGKAKKEVIKDNDALLWEMLEQQERKEN